MDEELAYRLAFILPVRIVVQGQPLFLESVAVVDNFEIEYILDSI